MEDQERIEREVAAAAAAVEEAKAEPDAPEAPEQAVRVTEINGREIEWDLEEDGEKVILHGTPLVDVCGGAGLLIVVSHNGQALSFTVGISVDDDETYRLPAAMLSGYSFRHIEFAVEKAHEMLGICHSIEDEVHRRNDEEKAERERIRNEKVSAATDWLAFTGD